jgi:hypothetical protein
MQLSGHRTRSVFDRYNIVSETDLTDAAAKLNTAHRDSSVTVSPKRAARASRLKRISSKKSWRRRPDLNRGWRFCRPLPYHLATAPAGTCAGRSGRVLGAATTATGRLQAAATNDHDRRQVLHSATLWSAFAPAALRRDNLRLHSCAEVGWSGKRDSNPRLRPWQGRTLPLSYSRSRTKS